MTRSKWRVLEPPYQRRYLSKIFNILEEKVCLCSICLEGTLQTPDIKPELTAIHQYKLFLESDGFDDLFLTEELIQSVPKSARPYFAQAFILSKLIKDQAND